MKREDFFTFEQYVESFKRCGVSTQDAKRQAKRQILNNHGTMSQYKKDLRRFSAEKKVRGKISDGLKEFAREVEDIKKNGRRNEEADEVYREAYTRAILAGNSRESAKRRARSEVRGWERSKSSISTDISAKEIIADIIEKNPDFDMQLEMEDQIELESMIDSGVKPLEALTEITNRVLEEKEKEEIDYINMGELEQRFYNELDEDSVDFLKDMQEAQPQEGWTAEKIFRYLNGDVDADSIKDTYEYEVKNRKATPGLKEEPKDHDEDYYCNLDREELDELDFENIEEEPEELDEEEEPEELDEEEEEIEEEFEEDGEENEI
jgi:hypothetical protein